ncbi:hypothetical protein [Olivibacter sitiensis]|uniref:hypothetical protein n=1 Tax=Olivibacter sitiensis TaxID=376470 RepID=UPI000485FD98|nr:hypothetical protein [Olivibacter sitiensis]
MSTLSKQLDKVVDKTTKLIELCLSLKEQNDMLQLQNQALEVALDTSKGKVKELEEKVKALAVARTLEGTSAVTRDVNEKTLDIKQKINDFVREIDKCIELLK